MIRAGALTLLLFLYWTWAVPKPLISCQEVSIGLPSLIVLCCNNEVMLRVLFIYNKYIYVYIVEKYYSEVYSNKFFKQCLACRFGGFVISHQYISCLCWDRIVIIILKLGLSRSAVMERVACTVCIMPGAVCPFVQIFFTSPIYILR